MPHIVLSEEQTQLVASSLYPVEIRDSAGHVVAVIDPVWGPDDLTEAHSRLASGEPSLSTAEMLDLLRKQFRP